MQMRVRTWVAAAAMALAAVACGGTQTVKKIQSAPMPEGGRFDGVFHSEAYGRLELTQNGDAVVGLYEGERFHGKIEGAVDGNVLHFRWVQWNEDLNGKVRETSGHGYFVYTIVDEGTPQKARLTHYIKGEWGYGESNHGNPWECVKFPEGTKKILKAHGQGKEEKAAAPDPFASPSQPAAQEAPASEPSSAPASSGGDDIDDLF